MTNDGDVAISPGGDLAVVSGIPNLDQAVRNRLLTEPDEYFFGDYGATLKQYVDSVDPTAVQKIPQDIAASLAQDPRIASASATATQATSGDITVVITYVSAFGDASTLEVSP